MGFALTSRNKYGYVIVVEHRAVHDLGGQRTLALSKEGRNWWAIMSKFHLTPNNPLLRNMTLEQRNFCIINMNQDALLAQGKTGDVAGDTTADKWLHASDKDFHVIPQTIASDNPEKTVIHNLRKKVGLSELKLDDQIWNNVKRNLPKKHAAKVREDQMVESEVATALMSKAKAYKKAGIDKSSSWDHYLDDNKKNKFNI